jgi:hypothetical protein
MGQNRKQDQDSPRRSTMEPAEGSKNMVRNSESPDVGSSSDREMFNDGGSSEERNPQPAERGRGDDGERNSRRSGITNRGADREAAEQEQLPERGHSQSER